MVIAAGVALLTQAWTSSRSSSEAGHAHTDAGTLQAGHHVSGYRLATIYDVNDPTQVLNLPAAEAPNTVLVVTPADDGGWDLKLDLVNFLFAPAYVEGPHVPGQGHAHLYVDGNYIADFTALGVRLPPLDQGTHEIAVGLNAIDHRAYARDGKVVVDRVVLRVGDPRRRVPPGEAKAFEVAVQNGKVAGTSDTLRVKQGDAIRLRWSSDAAITLHLEGYNIEALVSPASPATMQFVADLPGRFPVEQHAEGGAHGRGAVMYLEVYP